MRFAVIFDESPAFLPARNQYESAHLDFLEQHRQEIRMAGGLRNEHGGAYVGGLWVLEVASRDRAEELIQADPYYKAFPRPYRLLAWGKALPQFQVEM